MRLAGEILFSSFNNFKEHNVLDWVLTKYYGCNEKEVEKLFLEFNLKKELEE